MQALLTQLLHLVLIPAHLDQVRLIETVKKHLRHPLAEPTSPCRAIAPKHAGHRSALYLSHELWQGHNPATSSCSSQFLNMLPLFVNLHSNVFLSQGVAANLRLSCTDLQQAVLCQWGLTFDSQMFLQNDRPSVIYTIMVHSCNIILVSCFASLYRWQLPGTLVRTPNRAGPGAPALQSQSVEGRQGRPSRPEAQATHLQRPKTAMRQSTPEQTQGVAPGTL